MGRRGPAPTPTAILETRGSWRGKRGTQAPQPERVTPERPESLSPGAAEIWDRTVPLLETLGVLSADNGNALGRYCELMAEWVELRVFVAKQGSVYACDKGRNQVRRLSELTKQLLDLEREFGMTPSARSRIVIDAGQAKDELDEFLKLTSG